MSKAYIGVLRAIECTLPGIESRRLWERRFLGFLTSARLRCIETIDELQVSGDYITTAQVAIYERISAGPMYRELVSVQRYQA